jgi:glycosyltransferase involved in cell wall biosynthesis
MKISIITPNYNGGKYLESTILSVLNQDCKELEYIVIDGGSTDNSIEIIKKYEKSLAYWISEKDRGMYDAINKGIKRSTGDIVAYINSDDMYHSDVFQFVCKYFKDNIDIAMIYSDCDIVNGNGEKLYTYLFPEYNWNSFIRLNWSSIPQQTTFWRRELHEKIGYFDPELKMAGDFDFFARIGKTHKIKHVKNMVFSKFRFHEYSLSSTMKDLNIKEVRVIHDRYNISRNVLNEILRIITELKIKIINYRKFQILLGRFFT